MERWRDGVGKPPPRRCRDHPSFSSTLLDAIYRSIDETDEGGAMKEQRASGAPNPVPSRKKQSTAYDGESRRIPTVIEPAVIRPVCKPWAIGGGAARPATSSSSDGSSYGSFSSSEAESVSSRLRPIRTSASAPSALPVRPSRSRPDAGLPPLPSSPQAISPSGEEKRTRTDRHGSIRSRLRELSKVRAPASPGARLANFLNSLFAAKSKVSSASTTESACSSASASSYSRSCLSKTPSSRGKPSAEKRTVRFCPVSVIVGEDCRPCRQKFVQSEDSPPHAAAAPASRVAEMLRRSEEEEEDLGSDSSSDLFELENLAVIDRFRDELPVYETTHLANYNAIASVTRIPLTKF